MSLKRLDDREALQGKVQGLGPAGVVAAPHHSSTAIIFYLMCPLSPNSILHTLLSPRAAVTAAMARQRLFAPAAKKQNTIVRIFQSTRHKIIVSA